MSGRFRPDRDTILKYGIEFPAILSERNTPGRRKDLEKLFHHSDPELVAWAYFEASLYFRFYTEDFVRDECRKAVQYLEAALKHFREWPEAHLNLGVALSKLGKVEESVLHYEKATQYFQMAGANPDKHDQDAMLLGKIWLFRAHERLKLKTREAVAIARVELDKALDTLREHDTHAEYARWSAVAEQVDVELKAAERLYLF